jgi:hypothetical protein
MAALDALSREPFVAHMVAELRAEEPEIVAEATDDEVARFVRHGVARAASHGVTDAPLVVTFIRCMAWVGADFDTSPATAWAASILDDPALGPEDKMIRLEDHVMSTWEGSQGESPRPGDDAEAACR